MLLKVLPVQFIQHFLIQIHTFTSSIWQSSVYGNPQTSGCRAILIKLRDGVFSDGHRDWLRFFDHVTFPTELAIALPILGFVVHRPIIPPGVLGFVLLVSGPVRGHEGRTAFFVEGFPEVGEGGGERVWGVKLPEYTSL
jgi:hypothetical protein